MKIGITVSYQALTLGQFAKGIFFKDLEGELLSGRCTYTSAQIKLCRVRCLPPEPHLKDVNFQNQIFKKKTGIN